MTGRAGGLSFFGIGSRSSDLELQLPTKQYGEVLVGMTSGSTALKGVTADTLRLKMTSGRLTGANLTSSPDGGRRDQRKNDR